jgi:hypothetical protein
MSWLRMLNSQTPGFGGGAAVTTATAITKMNNGWNNLMLDRMGVRGLEVSDKESSRSVIKIFRESTV